MLWFNNFTLSVIKANAGAKVILMFQVYIGIIALRCEVMTVKLGRARIPG